MRRREFIASAVAAGATTFSPGFLRSALAAPAVAGAGPYGPLGAPDQWGLMLPPGFTSRQVARGSKLIGTYPWHFASDGQATYRTLDGGYILVSNSESPSATGGGSSAIRFSSGGQIQSAYRILAGTNLNCAGGPTPWGTWLSCEEHPGGMVWEADPAGKLLAQPRPALGNFAHEAAAVDPVDRRVYLTEDDPNSCFYRFTPDAYPSLLTGILEVAVVGAGGAVTWREVPDPNLVTQLKATRDQVPGATRFNGGEGLWYDDGVLYFTTKGDKKVWAYNARTSTIDVLFDRAAAPDSSLDAVDNVTVSASGDVYVCEDGGNMEIGIITPERVVSPYLRLVGSEHDASEMTGVIFDPSGTRMYFGSQRAYPYAAGTPAADGAIYEVTGPFRLPAGGVPPEKVFGPPAGERPVTLPDAASLPGLVLLIVERLLSRILGGVGLQSRVQLTEPATVTAVLRTAELETVKVPRWAEARPVLTTLGSLTTELGAGTHDLRLPVTLPSLARSGQVPAILTVVARTASGKRLVAARRVTV